MTVGTTILLNAVGNNKHMSIPLIVIDVEYAYAYKYT